MISRQVLKSLVPVAQQTIQKRGVNVISGPPLTRVSFAEKAVLGTIMISSMLVIPAWVLVNLKNYRGKE